MFKLSKVKKSLLGIVVVGALIAASVVPAFASYWNPLVEPSGAWQTGGYEGATVQRTIVATPMSYAPGDGHQTLMNMAANEAMVTAYGLQYNYREGIAGKIGTGMVQGFVPDYNLQVVKNSSGILVKARVALTARDVNGNPTGQSDIPSGAQLTYPTTNLQAYKDGSMIYIDGYWVGSSWYSRACYVNTNWASGSISSYYVYFQ